MRGRGVIITCLLGGVWLLAIGCQSEAKPGVEARKPLAVQTMAVERRDLPVVVEAVGRLMADREVVLAAEVGGVVKSYAADVGDRVRTGQELVTIDPADYRLALSEARAGLASAEAQYDAAAKAFERSRQLLPRKVISQDVFDRAEAEYKAAKAAMVRTRALVDIAASRLTKTSVRAPFDGLISARHVELGQTAAPGTPLLGLVDLSVMRVKIHLAEGDYVHLGPEDPVRVAVEAYPGREFKGRVDRIGIKADPMTNTFGVDVVVDNQDSFLKAGLTARVRLTVRVIPAAVLIPQSAVLYREDRREVFVASAGGRAEKRTVSLGRKDGDSIQILTGIEAGERLIVTGGQYLAPGDRIVATPRTAGGS